MVKRSEGFFLGKNDFELFYQAWTGDKSRGTLVVTHGLGEHSECYNRLANGLLPGDWDVYSWDLRGHGRSEGKRGTIRDFTDYCDDLKCFVEFVRKDTGGKPIVLLGHSMGGLVVASAVIKHGDMGAKSLCLSSPLFGIAVQVPKLKESLGKMVASVLPSLTLHNEINYGDLTHDHKVIEEYEKDVLRHDRISTFLFVEMLNTVDFAIEHAPKIKMPLYMQLSGDDRIVSRKRAELFFERAGSEKKELKVYEEYYHEIFNEVGRDTVYSDLKSWLKQFV